MSSDRITAGLMAELENEIDFDSEYEKLHEHKLDANYDGTLIFSTTFDAEPWEFGMMIGDNNESRSEFVEKCKGLGYNVVESTIKPFVSYWYDGSDSPQSDLSLEEFRKK